MEIKVDVFAQLLLFVQLMSYIQEHNLKKKKTGSLIYLCIKRQEMSVRKPMILQELNANIFTAVYANEKKH